MVGINTVKKDNPSLTCRLENGRNPYRIIIDPFLEISDDRNILHFEDKKNIIITSKIKTAKELKT